MSGSVPRTFLIRWALRRAPWVPSVCPFVNTLYSSSPSFLRSSHPSPQLIHYQNDRREFFHPVIKFNLILDLLSDGFIPSATHHPPPCHHDACASEARSPAGVAGSGAVSKWKALETQKLMTSSSLMASKQSHVGVGAQGMEPLRAH